MNIGNKTLLLQQVTVVDPNSNWNQKKVDLLIQDGEIVKIKRKISQPGTYDLVLSAKGFAVTGGWLDIGAIAGEPGEERNETLRSLSQGAAEGGYTSLGLFSNNAMPFDNKSIIADIKGRAAKLPVHLFPIGTISQHSQGTAMAEMLDMRTIGTKLFADCLTSKLEDQFLLKALLYGKSEALRCTVVPGANMLFPGGQVNESAQSAMLGLVGIPELGEFLACQRAIELAKYTEGFLYLHALSSARSVDLVKRAKKAGVNVMASVSSLHLLLNEDAVGNFDMNAKLLPPLRSEKDRKALIKGLRDGVLDAVVSLHCPIGVEQKDREFSNSPFGSINVQTSFNALCTAIPLLTLDEINRWFVENPRKIMSIDLPSIQEGSRAELTIFKTEGDQLYTAQAIRSTARNSLLTNEKLKGNVLATIKDNFITSKTLNNGK